MSSISEIVPVREKLSRKNVALNLFGIGTLVHRFTPQQPIGGVDCWTTSRCRACDEKNDRQIVAAYFFAIVVVTMIGDWFADAG